MSSIPIIRCSATVFPTTVSLPASPPPQIFLYLSITLDPTSSITLFAPFSPFDSRHQRIGHCDYRLRSLATDTILRSQTILCYLGSGKHRINEPSRDLLTLRPGQTLTRDVQIGVHTRMPLPGQHELDEQQMTVCAVPLENIEPGDYRIEECGGENGGWYWDEDEMGAGY